MRLDVSIPNIKTFVFGNIKKPLQPNTQKRKAEDILSKNMTIQEKIDGTKLTLVRTDQDSPNYADNWVVSYKGTVLYSSEFEDLTDSDIEKIKSKSTGISQYALVFDHLKKLNKNINKIPKNTEFSVEFAQNKETLTRTYDSSGEMFLRSYSQSEYYTKDGKLISIPKKEVTDINKVSQMAEKLKMMSFPVWVTGKIDSFENASQSIENKELKQNFLQDNIRWSDPVDIIEKFSASVLSTESILGGKPEGVVIILEDGRFFKIVQEDQYDKSVRDEKKQQYKADYDTENKYFQHIRKFITLVFSKIDMEKPPQSIMKQLMGNIRKSKARIQSTISHPKKNIDQIIDDIHETAKLMIVKSNTIDNNLKSIALIPIAGKPLHIGHWKLIELASNHNDRVIVYISTKTRKRAKEINISGKESMLVWKNFYLNILPKNVKVEFVDSPVQSLFYELQWINQRIAQDKQSSLVIKLYSDEDDSKSNFPEDRLKKYAPDIRRFIKRIGVSRNNTVNISGTQMRKFIEDEDGENFMRFLPPVNIEDKTRIWNIMKPKDTITSEQLKTLIRECIGQYKNLLTESGQAGASLDSKTPKMFNGQPAKALEKLSIKGGQAPTVSTDIKELMLTLNSQLSFWKPNNPFIHSGYMFNGSAQHLMNPKLIDKIENVKPMFGDIDVIIPMKKLDDVVNFLDTIDDKQVHWKPTKENRITDKFHYVGRSIGSRSLPDQRFTFWWYQPKNQIVQIDFEGDEMEIVDIGGIKFQKPSSWTKFSKDSPWDDLEQGIKGLAGALLLRSLARTSTKINNAVVLTPTGSKKFIAGKELLDRDISKSKQHTIPSQYTLNTGGGGQGIRKAYKKVGTLPDGRDGYIFVDPKLGRQLGKEFATITDLNRIFEVIFKSKPSTDDIKRFRSLQGLLNLMKKYLDRKNIMDGLKRFDDLLKQESLSDQEMSSIVNKIKEIF